MTYHAGSPIEGIAMCYPSDKTLECGICSRYRSGFAMPAELRAIPVIDASTVRKDGLCPMYAARETARPFCETEHA